MFHLNPVEILKQSPRDFHAFIAITLAAQSQNMRPFLKFQKGGKKNLLAGIAAAMYAAFKAAK